MSEKKFSDRFKARLALEAIEGKQNPEELSDKYGVPISRIRQWSDLLKARAETVFIEEDFGHEVTTSSRKQHEHETLRSYNSLLRATLDATVNGILVVDNNNRIVIYNQRFLEMWQIPEQVIAQGDDEKAVKFVLDQLEKPEQFRKRIKELYHKPEATSKDELTFKDGRVFERYSFPQRMAGEIVGRVWSFIDVTEQREAQDKMNRFGQLLKSINANVDEGILRSTPEDGFIYVNDAFVKMFGYESKEEAMAVPPEKFYADPDQRWKLVEKLEKNKRITNEEVKYSRKDGSAFWGLENCTLVETNGQRFIDGVINDITEKKEVEEALRQSEEKYRTILENIEDGYFEADLKGDLTFFNQALQHVLGYPEEELMGLNNRAYMDEENARGAYQAFNKVYRTGEPEQAYDWEIIAKNGEKHFVEASITLKKDSEGNPDGFRGIVRDITARKQQEEHIKKSLKEKEILLGEIHHRVKNNLAVISGLLYLQAGKTEDKRARTLLTQSQSRIHSMAMVHEMLYSTKSFASINPGTYIQELITYITQNMDQEEKDITTEVKTGNIQLNMQTSIPCALIINELLTNAYKYAFNGKKEGHIKIIFEQNDGMYKLIISDNGIGFSEKPVIDRDTGEGLGLFLVNTLTKQLDGEIGINIENGTRFEITFPSN